MATITEQTQNNNAAQLLTVAEYLKMDDNNEVQHEYHDGFIRAMSGGTQAHNTIILNIATYLRAKAAQQGCRVFAEGMRFQVASTYFFYPDVMVACEGLNDTERTILKACFVAEVLSESTLANDFGRKFFSYMNNPYVQTIMYVFQTERKVFVYQKGSEGWDMREVTHGEVFVSCLGVSLTLEQVYEFTAIEQQKV